MSSFHSSAMCLADETSFLHHLRLHGTERIFDLSKIRALRCSVHTKLTLHVKKFSSVLTEQKY